MQDDNILKSLLGFDKMLTPVVIRVLYYLGLLLVLVFGVITLFNNFMIGLLGIVGGFIGVRIWCELMIVIFGIHENLVALNRKTSDRNAPAS